MITIAPIYERDGDGLSREFFRPEFLTQRLGKRGGWQGDGAKQLPLPKSVQRSAFENLLHGRSPDGAKALRAEPGPPQRELGWRILMSGTQSVSVLWALAPERQRDRIEAAHANAVTLALWDFGPTLSGYDYERAVPRNEFPGALFATFRCGADWDQMPHLHTTVFLFNLAFHQDGTVRTFTADQVRGQRLHLKTHYETLYGANLQREAIGAYQQYADSDLRIAGVPQELCRKFFFDSHFSQQKTDAAGQPVDRLSNHELFGSWQRLADPGGWSTKEAEAFLRYTSRRKVWKDAVRTGQSLAHGAAGTVRAARESLKQLLRPKEHRSEQSRSEQSKDDGHSH